MGRIHDAVQTLFGRSEAQYEIARIRAQWSDLALDIASTLEKLNTWSARQAKRESRAARTALADQVPALPLPPKLTVSERKAALRRKVFGGGTLPLPFSPVEIPKNEVEDEQNYQTGTG